MSRPIIRVDLAEVGLEGQWVEIYDPRFMSYRKAQELRHASELNGQGEEVAVKALLDSLADWYVYDADSGELIARPPTAEGIGGLPAIALRAIGERMREAAEAPIPKAPSTPSKPG